MGMMKDPTPMDDEQLNVDALAENASSRSDPLWTVEEVAIYLQKGSETIRCMARSGEIKAYKVGREWRFTKKTIDDYLANCLYLKKEKKPSG
jgi:excisionase family DNA binding protein